MRAGAAGGTPADAKETTTVHGWSPATVADALAEGLARRARALDVEQAVTGLDQWSELELHPVLAEGALAAGFEIGRASCRERG